MADAFKIAYLPAHGTDEAVNLLLARGDLCSTNAVQSVEMLIELMDADSTTCDLILVPARLADGTSGVAACAGIKASKALLVLPVVGVALTRDMAVANAFYLAGADCVVFPPFDADFLVMQLMALRRLQQAISNEALRSLERGKLTRYFADAFNSVDQGVILVSPEMQLLSCNTAACSLLSYPEPALVLQDAHVAAQIGELISRFESSSRRKQPVRHAAGDVFSVDAPLTRRDGQSFPARIHARKLLSESKSNLAYIVVIGDASHVSNLRELLEQYRRARSVLLLTTACAFSPTAAKNSGVIVDPLAIITKAGAELQRACSVNAVVSCLLGILDVVVSPAIAIKVNMKQDPILALTFTDLFQMLGHLVLNAVEHAGLAGETEIDVGPNIPGEGVAMMITSSSRRVTEGATQGDPIAALLADFIGGVTRASSADSTHSGFSCPTAEDIAMRYRTSIEFQRPSSTVIRFRVRLPVVK